MDTDDDIMSNLSSEDDALRDDSDMDDLSGGEGEPASVGNSLSKTLAP